MLVIVDHFKQNEQYSLHMIPIIISGGSGTRLWPLSRAQYPKQFCSIFGSSLQTKTLQRCQKLGSPWVLTGKALQNLTEINLRENGFSTESVIYEPFGKNTAPAIALLCRVFQTKNLQKEVVGVFPSDHLIRKENEFVQAVRVAENMAQQKKIVTLGIQPTYAETGYGYIQTGRQEVSKNVYSVLKFHEKPKKEKAEEFLTVGGFYWNAGVFIFQIEMMIQHFEKHQSVLWKEISNLKSDLSNIEQVYGAVQSISIDYAIMEKLSAEELVCVPADIGWSDVGSWDSVAEEFAKEKQHAVGGKSVEVSAKNNFSYIPQGKKVAFVGVDDLIVVDTGDVLLVAKKGETQKLREAVEQVEKIDHQLTKVHSFEDRPWGRFEVLRDTEKFKSKVIRVNPQSQLSYQSHTKREEHWVVTAGEGEVVINDKTIPVKTGSYIHIPVGAKHRMRNSTNSPLEFVEVQLGSYFGEDDITRYQDDYKRS